MKKSKQTKSFTPMIESPVSVLIVAVLALILCVIFSFSNRANRPVPREEAISYEGTFDYYDDSWENYRTIYFEDGTSCEVYAHTETEDFRNKMDALPKGTKLYLLINPNNECAAEIRTDTQELLNFETSQQEIYQYGKGYVGIGIFAGAACVFLIAYSVGLAVHNRKEEERHAAKKNKPTAVRRADPTVKSRTLLKAQVQEYEICYRRVKKTNELVVNGFVYDEFTAVVEFSHKLCARVDGHKIEAGYDSDSFSYILFDDQPVARKRRWF